jgi:hypothetical protein
MVTKSEKISGFMLAPDLVMILNARLQTLSNAATTVRADPLWNSRRKCPWEIQLGASTDKKYVLLRRKNKTFSSE